MFKGRSTVRTAKARASFLATLADACNVTAACRATGIGRETHTKDGATVAAVQAFFNRGGGPVGNEDD